jgi:hypothetical protein
MSLLTDASLIVTPNAYKEGKLYSVVPSDGSGDFSVTRATTATRVNAAGLVELVPYNLLRNSQDFTSVWAYDNNTSSANTIAAPDGTLTADTIVNNNTNAYHRYYQGPIANLGQPQTISFSVYLKYKDHQYTSIGVTDDSFYRSQVVVDLVNGTITENYKHNSGDTLTSTITNVGNGWYRVTGTFTYATALDGGNAYVLGMLLNQSTFTSAGYAGSGTGIYIWGAQLVEGSSALDYQATETRLNIPRLDYSLGSCPNILLEPQRTNLITYSEQFDVSIWFKLDATITSNTTNSPTGTQNADKLVATSTNVFHGTYQNNSIPASTGIYTASCYAKKGEYNFLLFDMWNGTGVTGDSLVWFDLNNGTVGTITNATTGSSSTTATIQNAGNGWYRCTMTINKTSTTSGLFVVSLSNTDNVSSYAGDNTSGIFIWGAQVEVGAYATSYIPTTSASVTRNADVISRGNIFTNGLITASGGTWFVDLKDNIARRRDAGGWGIALTNNNTSYDFGFLILTPSTISARYDIFVRIGGVGTTIFSTTETNCKLAIKWNGTTADVFQNGVKVVSALAFTQTAMQIVSSAPMDTPKNINSMALFPTPLTDGQCSMLTSGIYTPTLAYAQLGLVSESPACLDSSVNALL